MGRVFKFMELHPDVDIGRIDSAYASCQGEIQDDIFRVYEHVRKCDQCQSYLAYEEKLDRIYDINRAMRRAEINACRKAGLGAS